MKKLTIIIFFVSFSQFFSQEDKSQENTGLIILNDVIVLAPALLSVMIFHEVGHYSMAKISGASDIKIGLYKSNPDGGYSIGWSEMNDTLPSFGNTIYNFGGVLFSRGFSELSRLTINSNIFPTAINRYFAMTYLIGRFDYSRYVLQDALINLFGGTGSDMDNIVTEIAGKSTGWRTITYASLLTIGVLDLVWGWEDIEHYWALLVGGDHKSRKVQNNYKLGIYPMGASINISFVMDL